MNKMMTDECLNDGCFEDMQCPKIGHDGHEEDIDSMILNCIKER